MADMVKWNSTTEQAGEGDSEILVLSDRETSSCSTDCHLERESRCPPTYLLVVVGFSTIGGFLFGYDTGVISGALLALDEDFKYELSALQKELIVAITIAAAAIGALTGGLTNEYLGRKLSIMIASVIFTLGAIVMSAAPLQSYGWLVILAGRCIVGISIGIASMTVPVYLAECSPVRFRGRLTIMDITAVTGGQFVAAIVDYIFSYVPQGWRYMFGLAAIPSAVRFIAFFFLPESPRWLVGKGRTEKARQVLLKLRGSGNGQVVEQELEEICLNIKETSAQNEQNFLQKLVYMLTHRHLLTALIVGCGLQAIQQLSGINTAMYYSPTIMKMAGAVDNHAAIGLGAVVAFGNFSFTLVGLYFVEKSGRRKLILTSLGGVVFSLLALSVAFSLTHSSTQPACSTSKCAQTNCDDCVIEDNCYFCNFPFESDYGANDTTGFCVDRNWTTFGQQLDNATSTYCWVPEMVLLDDGESCPDLSYTTPGSLPLNSSMRGSLFSNCPNQYSWLALGALVMYIVFFAPGMGPIPWTVNAEIYPNWARSVGNSASTATNWLCNFLVSVSFLHLTNYLKPYGAFFLYTGLATGGFVFILFMLPETKGRTLETVEEIFQRPPCPPPGISKQVGTYTLLDKQEAREQDQPDEVQEDTNDCD